MDQSANLFSYCVGGFALISTLVSIAIFSRGYLPTAQMKILTEYLDETKEIYEKAEADQLLPDERFRRAVRKKLAGYEGAAFTLRVKAYESMSLQDECLAAMSGLSQKIIQLSYKVKKLRSLILWTSEEQGRRKRERIRSIRPLTDAEERDADHSVVNTLYDPSPITGVPSTTDQTETHTPLAPLPDDTQSESASLDSTDTMLSTSVRVGRIEEEMYTSPSELATMIRQLDSLDEPPASSSSRRWSLRGGESPAEVDSPSHSVTTTTEDRHHPSLSESSLNSSPNLLNSKPHPWSFFTWCASARSSALKSESDVPSETGGTSPSLHLWSLFEWWKNRPFHHQTVRAASPDVGSLPV